MTLGEDRDGSTLDALVRALTDASIAAQRLGGAPVEGVRAVTLDGTDRYYLAALDGPRFVCLGADARAVRSRRIVTAVGAAVLLVERAEDEVDVAALHDLAGAFTALMTGPNVLGLSGADASSILRAAADAAYRLAAWRAAPDRALASIPELEQATQLHDRLRVANAEFVRMTDPLVADQATLDAPLIEALQEIDAASAAANVGGSLAGRLADWIPDCDEGALDILRAHITPLDDAVA